MMPTHGALPVRIQREIIDAVLAYMGRAELSQADVAKAIGQSTTYINNVLNGTGNIPPAAVDQILRDLNNWLDREVRARDNAKPESFAYTRVALRLFNVAQTLTERADIAIAYGPAGIGKSITAEAICAEIPTAAYVLVDDDCRTACGLRDKLYNALSRRKRTTRGRVADVVNKLRQPAKVKTVALVMVDEANQLRPGAFEFLRNLHDQAGCSILLLGTIDLRVQTSYDDDDDLGQFASRVGQRIPLAEELTGCGGDGRGLERLFTMQDIRAMFSQGKLKLHSSATRLLATVANTKRGTLRTAKRLTYFAIKAALARKANQVFAEDVRTAAEIVGVDIAYADLAPTAEADLDTPNVAEAAG